MSEILRENPEAVEPEIKRKSKRIKVDVISVSGKTSLVKYIDRDVLRKVYIPSNKIATGKVEEQFLTKGVLYGLAWEEVELPEITGEAFAQAMRNRNIWTAEESRANPNGIRAAIASLYAPIFVALANFLREQQEKTKGGK